MQSGKFVPQRLRPRYAIAPFVVVAALALAACGGSSNTATETAASSASTSQATTETSTQVAGQATSEATGEATATTAPAPTTAPATTTAAATKAPTAASGSGTSVPLSAVSPFSDLADSWSSLKSYKMTVKIYDNGSDTPSVTGTVETEVPDKNHMVVNASGQEFEVISIGDTTYVKLAGTWQQAPGGMMSQMPSITAPDILNQVGTPSAIPNDVTKTGEETINGVKCDVYKATVSDSTTSTLWVGQKDHLPYKAETQSDTTRTEVLFSDFNADFNIQAPI